jgi:TRAP-type C4-dicarboxylate transport system permease small subunit
MNDEGKSPAADRLDRRAGLRALPDRCVELVAVVLMLAMLGTVVLGVATRSAGRPVVWTDELAQYLLVWLGFVGFILASRRGSHIRVTVLLDRFPERLRKLLEVAIRLAIVVFAAVLIWQAGPLIRRNIDVETVTLPFPAAVLYVLLPVLGLALAVQAAVDIGDIVRVGPARSDTSRTR